MYAYGLSKPMRSHEVEYNTTFSGYSESWRTIDESLSVVKIWANQFCQNGTKVLQAQGKEHDNIFQLDAIAWTTLWKQKAVAEHSLAYRVAKFQDAPQDFLSSWSSNYGLSFGMQEIDCRCFWYEQPWPNLLCVEAYSGFGNNPVVVRRLNWF